jgi:hypothetical protein
MPDITPNNNKDETKDGQEVKPEIQNDSPDQAEVTPGASAPAGGNNLKIESVSGPGARQTGANSIEIDQTQNIDVPPDDKAGTPTLNSQEQRQAEVDLKRPLPNQSPNQQPQDDPNKFNPQESAPLSPSETPPASGPGGGSGSEQAGGANPDGQSSAENSGPEGTRSPADNAGGEQNQTDPRDIAAQIQNSQMRQRYQLIKQRQQLSQDTKELGSDATQLSLLDGFPILQFLMPELSGKINNAVSGGDKQSTSRGRLAALQAKSALLEELANLLLMARILFTGVIDGIIKYWTTWVPWAAPIYWWLIVTAIIDLIVVQLFFIFIFVPMGGELSMAVMQVRKRVVDLKTQIDDQIAALKKKLIKQRQQRQRDSALAMK